MKNINNKESSLNKQGRSKVRLVVSILVLLLLAVFTTAGVVGYRYYNNIQNVVERDVIYEGIKIHNIDVGGMTKAEALGVLEDYITKDNLDKKIVLYYEEQNWILTYEDWGFASNIEELINKAYSIGKDGKLIERYKIITGLQSDQISYDIVYEYDDKVIDEVLLNIKKNFINEPKNAILKRVNNEFIITDEVVGYDLNIEASKAKIKEKLDARQEGRVELVVHVNVPQLTKEYLSHVDNTLGGFYTNFSLENENRNTNLKIAASKINGKMLMPGEVFSLMDTIGPVDLEHGYQNAPVIVNGVLVPGVGGGICQVATTLYNSVLFSELEVVERSNHSMPVAYVPLGQDATVSGSVIDFKFKNNTNYPVYLESYIEDNKLYANIYGDGNRPPNRNVKFLPVVIETIEPPPEQIEIDETLKKGEEYIKVYPKKGYRVKLYKETYEEDQLISTEVVDYSYYRPRAGVRVIGDKAVTTSDIEDLPIREQPEGEPIQDDNIIEYEIEQEEVAGDQTIEEVIEDEVIEVEIIEDGEVNGNEEEPSVQEEEPNAEEEEEKITEEEIKENNEHLEDGAI